MGEHGYTRSWLQCQRKMKHLKMAYRKAKDNNNRSGRGRITCPFFDELDAVLGDRPAFCPGEGDVIDSKITSVTMDTTSTYSDEDNGVNDGEKEGKSGQCVVVIQQLCTNNIYI